MGYPTIGSFFVITFHRDVGNQAAACLQLRWESDCLPLILLLLCTFHIPLSGIYKRRAYAAYLECYFFLAS